MQFTGIGGQVDFVRGAARSSDGKAIIALPSTAKKGTVSRIVAALAPGAAVTTMRADVDYVVTEHGVAHLRGKGLRERAEALIDIADPAFRDQIREEAAALYGRRPPRRVTPRHLRHGDDHGTSRRHVHGQPRSASTRAPKTLITGNGAVAQLGVEAKKLNGTKVLIITDPGVASAAGRRRRAAAARGRPRGRRLRQGRPRAAHEHRPRGRRLRREGRLRPHRRLRRRLGHRRRQGRRRARRTPTTSSRTTSASTRCRKKGLPIIAVPTTAGTGSEVTAIAIFANEKLNVKQGVVSPYLIPNVALVDPVLT